MHRESPPPMTEQPHSPHDIRHQLSRKTTWRNPNCNTPKSGTISTDGGDRPTSTSGRNTQPKVLPYTTRNIIVLNQEPKVLSHTGRKINDLNKQPKVLSHAGRKTNDLNQQPKVLSRTGRKTNDLDQDIVISAVTGDCGLKDQQIEPEKSCADFLSLNQCKYWVSGNCVHGDNCKDLHSWSSGTGFTMVTKLEGHTKAISGISLPSGSHKLYSGGKDKCIRAWDCSSGQCAGSVCLDGEVGCLINEGPWVFVGLPNTVKVWNSQNQAEFSLSGPVGQVHCMVVDDDKLFAGIEDGTILVWKWNPETGVPEPAAILKGHSGAVCSLVIGANRLYSGSRDCTIKMWDIQKLEFMQTLDGHTRDVTSVICWDRYLLSASLDNTLKVWSATESGTLKVAHEIKEDHGVIALCGIHDAEARPILLCSYNDNTIRLYDLPSFAERGRIFSKREVEVIQIGIDGLFFTGDATGEVSVWKLNGVPQEPTSQ
ncbi:hypothetical protein RD792_010626 [Penstemon davidsonii]|uniref:C3H1-type domain-containing protein n=1 Tax=Penstemon davidsonii TaxID=160366 RepID=A0ABR0D2D8_9LAMI|nr:hypothetical protein RD792_010626 [Penstemon davidsonii]